MSGSLVEILNQPFAVTPLQDSCIVGDNMGYCQLKQAGDPLKYQWKQIPCGGQLICDPDFDEMGAQLDTNGTFTGSAAGWTLGANWAYGANDVIHTVGNTAKITQSIASMIAGKTYFIEYVVTGRTAGSVGSYVGGAAGVTNTANGNFTELVNAGSANILFGITPTTDFDGHITTLWITEMSPCWQTVSGDITSVFYSTGSVCHTAGAARSACIKNTIPLVVGTYYKITGTVTGMTAGSVRISAGTDFYDITENGTFTEYLTADTPDFSICFTDDFDGCITHADAYPLSKAWKAVLIDSNGNSVCELSISYNNEYCTIDYAAMTDIIDWDGAPIEYGCYTIGIADPCLNTNDQFTKEYAIKGTFPDNDPQATWLENDAFVNGISGGEAVATSDGVHNLNTLIETSTQGITAGKYYDCSLYTKAVPFDASF